MVLEIPVWYLHPPEMVPQPSLPPQTEGNPDPNSNTNPTTPPPPHSPTPPLQLGADGRRKSLPLLLAHEFNLLVHYARKMDTPLISSHPSLSYRI
jgi:hypothetical protein